MNYFELYPGDYLRDTTRLTLVDHGAYLRLLMTYYAEEQALPADLAELYNIAGATDSAGKKAVKKVAEKYFPKGSDGLRHNGRADEEIAKAAERMEGADERKANDADRKRRSRERRAAWFSALREVGIVPDFDATMGELRARLLENVTPDRCVTLGVTTRDKSRESHRDGTATRPQTPDPTRKATAGTPHTTGDGDTPPDGDSGPARGTLAGPAAVAMRKAGIRVTSQNPDLIAAVDVEGVPITALVEFAELYPHKPAGYVIAAARRQHAEQAADIEPGASHVPGNSSRHRSVVERVRANVHAAEQRDRAAAADGDAHALDSDG